MFPIPTRVLLALWLLVILLAAIAIALIVLTVPTSASTAYVIQIGTLGVADLGGLDINSFQSLGITGANQAVGDDAGDIGDVEGPATSPMTLWNDCASASVEDDCHGMWHYRFLDVNADVPTNLMPSSRTISAEAKCQSYNVVEGNWGNESSVAYEKNGEVVTQNIESQGCMGEMSYIYYTQAAQDCGARCAVVNAFQAAATDEHSDGVSGGFYECTVKIGNNVASSGVFDPQLHPETILLDKVARLLGGAIAIGGNPNGLNIGFTTENGPQPYTQLYTLYPQQSQFDPLITVIPEDIADLLAQFSLQSIGSLDYYDPSSRLNITNQPVPISTSKLDVDWLSAGVVLALLPVIQLITFLIVVAWANKAIIRDDEPLSTARLLQPLLGKLGPGGCLLDNEEIIEAIDNPGIAYNFSVSERTGTMRVSVVEQGPGLAIRNSFIDGVYD
jgi:hypothetical protein